MLSIRDRFGLLKDLGVITVPKDFDSENCFSDFRNGKTGNFFYDHSEMNDANFPNPTVRLKPGQKFQVVAFTQWDNDTMPSEDRLNFLTEMKSSLVGAQGLLLVYQQKRSELTKGYRYTSFDQKERLWKNRNDDYCVPDLDVTHDGEFEFFFALYDGLWSRGNAVLYFRKISRWETFRNWFDEIFNTPHRRTG